MKKEKEPLKEQEEGVYINNQQQELPALVLNYQSSLEGLIHLESKGHTIEEAANGMSFLIKKLKEFKEPIKKKNPMGW